MIYSLEDVPCFSCVNEYFLMYLTAQLEAALATFYAPKPSISESTILEYREPVGLLARRFFHLLLRYLEMHTNSMSSTIS